MSALLSTDIVPGVRAWQSQRGAGASDHEWTSFQNVRRQWTSSSLPWSPSTGSFTKYQEFSVSQWVGDLGDSLDRFLHPTIQQCLYNGFIIISTVKRNMGPRGS
jgi:hypothetical protein